MLKILIKKQLSEVFKSYFYDAKKNRMRSKGAIIGYFVFFFFVMVVFLGGMFTALSLSICGPLTEAGMGWLYFLLMGGIAVALGVFGGVFNSYAGLYLAKDNDLLLALPIPVRTIITARLVNVYLMGAMYSAVVLLPTLIVNWIVVGATAANVICGILFFFITTIFILLLAALLGWVVAQISLRLKNKSYISVIVSLAFIAAYYFVYFRANDFIRELLQNADVYGEKIRGAACGLYLYGRIGEGDWPAAGIFAAAAAILLVLIGVVLSRSFLNIVGSSGSVKKVRYTEKAVRQRTPFGALLSKEFGRFTSSSNYMLNCGLGILLIPAFGVLLLFKGGELCQALDSVFASSRPGSTAVLLCTALCMLNAMIDMASPSVSLEGKNLWIPQSLPVEAKTVLRAKSSVQLILSEIPMLFASVCAALVLPASPAVRVMIIILPLVYAAFSAVFDTVISVRMPLLSWTNETAPIKQSGSVTLALFGGWAIAVVIAGLYLLVGYLLGAAVYLLIWTVIFAAAALVLLRWLDTKGADIFAEL